MNEQIEKPSLDKLQEKVEELKRYALSFRSNIKIEITVYEGFRDRDYGITTFESKSSIKIGKD